MKGFWEHDKSNHIKIFKLNFSNMCGNLSALPFFSFQLIIILKKTKKKNIKNGFHIYELVFTESGLSINILKQIKIHCRTLSKLSKQPEILVCFMTLCDFQSSSIDADCLVTLLLKINSWWHFKCIPWCVQLFEENKCFEISLLFH